MDQYKTYPIILAHGIARFDELSRQLLDIDNRDALDALHYFKNIRTHLQSHGFYVRHTNVDWAGSVDERSGQLKQQIEGVLNDEELGAEQVHIIAHSMGGLDSRHMLFDNRDEGFHEKIASLTTIATPHNGSPIADSIVGGIGDLLKKLGFGEGTHDLTTEACCKFNAESEAFERECGVHFRSYAGKQKRRYVFTPLKPAWDIVHESEPEFGNDGLVSVDSARWKEEYFRKPVLDADHFNLCGWWDFSELLHLKLRGQLEGEIKAFYLCIAERLAKRFPPA
ncbi:MAG: hypothetical protein JSU63_14860 [Phycisphaerales bacterium]|nr:MAG: hypothetical protein JSU63_14860 [Phycisphaerales bacterium]